ncbi:MAG: NifU family protein [Dissulfurispiraceae bacterium]
MRYYEKKVSLLEVSVITKERVEEVLNKVRVGLKAEGGDIDLVEIKDDEVFVKLKGACGTCPMSTLTLKNWVETTLKREIPEVKAVKAL